MYRGLHAAVHSVELRQNVRQPGWLRRLEMTTGPSQRIAVPRQRSGERRDTPAVPGPSEPQTCGLACAAGRRRGGAAHRNTRRDMDPLLHASGRCRHREHRRGYLLLGGFALCDVALAADAVARRPLRSRTTHVGCRGVLAGVACAWRRCRGLHPADVRSQDAGSLSRVDAHRVRTRCLPWWWTRAAPSSISRRA